MFVVGDVCFRLLRAKVGVYRHTCSLTSCDSVLPIASRQAAAWCNTLLPQPIHDETLVFWNADGSPRVPEEYAALVAAYPPATAPRTVA